MSQTICVLGSNSFAGSHLVDALLRFEPDARILGVSRSPEKSALFLPYKGQEQGRFEFNRLDMVADSARLVRLLDEEKPAVIVNFAALNEVAPSNDHPDDYFLTNCVALGHMCDALRRRDYLKQYIHISSPEVYGSCAHPLTEDAPMNPSTPYAASKGGADLLLMALWKTFQFPVMLVRSTNYYGSRQQLHKVIPRTVIRVRRGERLQLHGGGKAVKSWIHVRDVARALIACMHRGQAGEIYHLSDQNAVSVREVVEKVGAMMGKSLDQCAEIVEERQGQDARYILDYAKAQRELGWSPREPFDASLREVVDWIADNWDEVQRSPHDYKHIAPSMAAV